MGLGFLQCSPFCLKLKGKHCLWPWFLNLFHMLTENVLYVKVRLKVKGVSAKPSKTFIIMDFKSAVGQTQIAY